MEATKRTLDFTRQIDVSFKKTNGDYVNYMCKFNDERHMNNYIAKMERERMFKHLTTAQYEEGTKG